MERFGRKSLRGRFRQWHLSGSGVFTLRDGSVSKGKFRAGLMEGAGKQPSAAEGCTRVEFKNGKPEGKGAMELRDGRKYAGDFKNSLYEGKGILIIPQRGTYAGEFKNGKYDGNGTFGFTNGLKIVGHYTCRRVGRAVHHHPERWRGHESRVQQGVPDGRWSSTTPGGEEKEWEIKDGIPEEIKQILKGT